MQQLKHKLHGFCIFKRETEVGLHYILKKYHHLIATGQPLKHIHCLIH